MNPRGCVTDRDGVGLFVKRLGSREQRCSVPVFSEAEQDDVDPREMRRGAVCEAAQDLLIFLGSCEGVFDFTPHPINMIRGDPQWLKEGGLGHGEVASRVLGRNTAFIAEEKKDP